MYFLYNTTALSRRIKQQFHNITKQGPLSLSLGAYQVFKAESALETGLCSVLECDPRSWSGPNLSDPRGGSLIVQRD
ncbi:hypothetical protein JTE90_002745 [Oedothorax gibbosus]|uniref:Uncharacterized protein n=1 Tax=Oedothorax gibbosus TaxID=931172 RepID=A0AAV6VVT1_9ARAC|nr:hypothetical protein JTE90_002745 [Oedothorax gibbosus]